MTRLGRWVGTMAADQDGSFKGRHFTSEVILGALRWHLAFPISYRDLALMLSDRGVAVDHTTLMWTAPGRQGFFVCQTTRFDRV